MKHHVKLHTCLNSHEHHMCRRSSEEFSFSFLASQINSLRCVFISSSHAEMNCEDVVVFVMRSMINEDTRDLYERFVKLNQCLIRNFENYGKVVGSNPESFSKICFHTITNELFLLLFLIFIKCVSNSKLLFLPNFYSLFLILDA